MTRLFHVSDLHFGREDEEAVAWFAATVAKEMPDAVVCTGDLTMRARAREFAAAGDYLDALPVPVTVEPGNHDLPYFNPVDRMFRPYRRFGKIEKMVERPIDLDKVTVVPLRTTARAQWRSNWSWGVVNRTSLEHALALLAKADPSHVKLVACHHPLIDKEGLEAEGRTLRGRKAVQALAEAGADGVLSGHVHDPFEMFQEVGDRTIRLIGAGTLSERIRSTPPGFNEIAIGADRTFKVTARVMRPDHSAAREPVPVEAPAAPI